MADIKRKVIPLHRITELDDYLRREAVESTGNTTGSVLADFALMWMPAYFRHVDWFRVGRGLAALVFFLAMGAALWPHFFN